MLVSKRRSFSRVSKLLSLFGYGASTPYNDAALKDQHIISPNGTANKTTRGQWFDSKFKDSKDFGSQVSDWKDMVSYSPIAAAVRLIVEECIQTEQTCPAVLWADGGEEDVIDEVNDLFLSKLKIEEVIRSQFWWVIGYGNNFEKLVTGPEGVHGWYSVPLDSIDRIVDEQHRLIGFDYKEEQPPEGENSCAIWGEDTGGSNVKRLWRPWDFIHMRLMGENRESEYGTSLLYPAANVYKKLRMAEDQMITYRLQMQPSRYLLKLDTGEGGVPDMWSLSNQWNNYLRSNRLIDSKDNKYEVRYNPWSLDDLIIIPRRKDSQSDFTKLQGDTEVPDITDVKYLMRMMAGMMNVPPEFMGLEASNGSTLTAKSSLAVQNIRFLRSLKSCRSAVMQGYDYTARIHLALNNKDPFVPMRMVMSNITALESQNQIELADAQSLLVDKLIQLGDNIRAPKAEWLRMVFTKFMPLPDELVDMIAINSAGDVMDGNQQQGGGLGGLGGLGGGLGGLGGGLGGGGGFTGTPSEDSGTSGVDLGSIAGGVPEIPKESLNSPEMIHQYLAERYQHQRTQYNKACRVLRENRSRFFDPYIAYQRYKKTDKLLMESLGITGPNGLVLLREDIQKSVEYHRKNLVKNRPLLRCVGNITKMIDGYYPMFYHLNEEQADKLARTHRAVRRPASMVERKFYDKSNQESHEMVDLMESHRK